MTAYLLAESGIATPLHKGTVRVGSDGAAELPICEDLRLAPFHYEIVSSGEGGHAIYKLHAASRLLVNDKPVNDAELQDGDVITAGTTTLIYCSQVPDPPIPFAAAEIKPPHKADDEDHRASRVLAAFIATGVTVFAYSFVYNLGWVMFVIGTYLIGHMAGWLVKVIGDERDRSLGLLAAAAALGGVLIVNLLTHGGMLHMYEVVSVPGSAAIESPQASEPEAEEEMTKVGTGETAAKVAQLTVSEVWQRFMPTRQTGGRMKIIPVTGIMNIFFGAKSLWAYAIIAISAWRRAARKSIKVVPLNVSP